MDSACWQDFHFGFGHRHRRCPRAFGAGSERTRVSFCRAYAAIRALSLCPSLSFCVCVCAVRGKQSFVPDFPPVLRIVPCIRFLRTHPTQRATTSLFSHLFLVFLKASNLQKKRSPGWNGGKTKRQNMARSIGQSVRPSGSVGVFCLEGNKVNLLKEVYSISFILCCHARPPLQPSSFLQVSYLYIKA